MSQCSQNSVALREELCGQESFIEEPGEELSRNGVDEGDDVDWENESASEGDSGRASTREESVSEGSGILSLPATAVAEETVESDVNGQVTRADRLYKTYGEDLRKAVRFLKCFPCYKDSIGWHVEIMEVVADRFGVGMRRLKDIVKDIQETYPKDALVLLNHFAAEDQDKPILCPQVTTCKCCKYSNDVNGHRAGHDYELTLVKWKTRKGEIRCFQEVNLYEKDGTKREGLSVTLRCWKTLGGRRTCGGRYRYDSYRHPKIGKYIFYEERQPYVAATGTTYLARKLVDDYTFHAVFNHCPFKGYVDVLQTKSLSSNGTMLDPELSGFGEDEIETDRSVWEELDCDRGVEKDTYEMFLKEKGINRKILGEGFFRYHVEEELRESAMVEEVGFEIWTTVYDVMKELCKRRRDLLGFYEHACTDVCRKRGCGILFVLDGLWKLTFPHCSHELEESEARDDKFPGHKLPVVCSEPCVGRSCYCKVHFEMAVRAGRPTTAAEVKDGVLAKHRDEQKGVVTEKQMTLRSDKNKTKNSVETDDGKTFGKKREKKSREEKMCSKFLGKGLNHSRSQGYLFVVSAGGHIVDFEPLFGSESVAQVSRSTINFLEKLSNEEETWPSAENGRRIALSYDNMCNIDNYCKHEGRLTEEARNLWDVPLKIIDRLHLKNHVRPQCHTLYNAENLATLYPEIAFNTQSCEQVFSWLKYFKTQLFWMSRYRQEFFLHIMIKSHNEHISRLHGRGVDPYKSLRNLADRRLKKVVPCDREDVQVNDDGDD